jgi:hypothetical protein
MFETDFIIFKTDIYSDITLIFSLKGHSVLNKRCNFVF